MSTPDQRLPKLIELREQCHFVVNDLAEVAGVDPYTIITMLRSYPVSRRDALRVLDAFSHHSGKLYTLDNVRVPLLPDESEE